MRVPAGLLDVSCDAHRALHLLLFEEVLDKPCPLQGDAGLGGQRLGETHFVFPEGARAAVEHLNRAHHAALVVVQGHGQDVPRAPSGLAVHVGVESRVRVGVGHVDAHVGGGANLVPAGGDAADDLVGVGVVQPDRRALGVEKLHAPLDDEAEQAVEVFGGDHGAGDLEDPAHVADLFVVRARHVAVLVLSAAGGTG